MNTSALHSKSWNVTVAQVKTPVTSQDLSARDFTVHCPEMYWTWSCTVHGLFLNLADRFINFIDLDRSKRFSECNFRICKTWLHQCQSSFSQKLNGCGYAEEDTLRPLWWSQRFEGLGELRPGKWRRSAAAVVRHTKCTYMIIHVSELI